MFINTLVEGKIPVKALIDTSSKFNTISKSLFDKLKEDYGIRDPVENLYGDVIVLGQDWLWMREAKIIFGFSLENSSSSKNNSSSHKVTASSNFRSVRDNSSRHLSAKDIECAIKTAIDPLSSDLHKSQHCHRKKKKYGKAKIIKTVLISESDSSDSDSAISWHTS
ncbi:5572_t:CDS:2 [Diversispora eburnea]|uniref:5572_t:CDS:1 n=1 Tax=Diversispora eburnea TaxID=1213867 RepID=A0A9N9C7M4_9GLOM|nr:5572_t:CDS:2 [Diversispora eburnea]